MKCGHSIHKKCYEAHLKVSYKCPICSKSLVNMEYQFRNLDILIMAQPMPTEFRDTKATILCNDCSAKSTVPYHWIGLKCSICRSYNTAQLQLLGRDNQEIAPEGVTQGSNALPPARLVQTAQIPVGAPAAPRSRNGSVAAARRRHSSHGAELQFQRPDRIARSLSPVLAESSILRSLTLDSEDEDEHGLNIFGFWRQGDSSGGEEEDDDDGSELDDSDYPHDDEDDEDDEEDDIILIGHR